MAKEVAGTQRRDTVLSIVWIVLGAGLLVIFGGGSLILLAAGAGAGSAFLALLAGLGLVPALAGVPLLICGLVGLRRVRYRRDYAARLMHDPRHSVFTLAERVSLPVEKVVRRVNTMLHKGYFPGGYLEQNSGCIILPAEAQAVYATQQTSHAQYSIGRPDSLFHVQLERRAAGEADIERCVECGGCGAVQVVRGNTAVFCEYCKQPVTPNDGL